MWISLALWIALISWLTVWWWYLPAGVLAAGVIRGTTPSRLILQISLVAAVASGLLWAWLVPVMPSSELVLVIAALGCGAAALLSYAALDQPRAEQD